MATAIKTMVVRGAPAIGIAAAYGMYLGARDIQTSDKQTFLTQLEAIAQTLRQTRPTAVNLFWAIDRMLNIATTTSGTIEQVKQALLETAKSIQTEDVRDWDALAQTLAMREGPQAQPGAAAIC